MLNPLPKAIKLVSGRDGTEIQIFWLWNMFLLLLPYPYTFLCMNVSTVVIKEQRTDKRWNFQEKLMSDGD